MEEDREEILKSRGLTGLADMEVANKRLADENRKLRQMLVERNMEIAQRQAERNTLSTRVDNLERKQNDSDIKMQQLKGWVNDVGPYPSNSAPAPDPHRFSHPLSLPPIPVPAAASVKPARRKRLKGQRRDDSLNRSWEDLSRLKDDSSLRNTPGSLPAMLDNKVMLATEVHGQPGYYDMYRHKMRLVRDRKY
jgi:hypothetical protein